MVINSYHLILISILSVGDYFPDDLSMNNTVALEFSGCGKSSSQTQKVPLPESSVFPHNNFEHAKIRFFFNVDADNNISINKEKSDVRHPYSRVAVSIIKSEFIFSGCRYMEVEIEFFPKDIKWN